MKTLRELQAEAHANSVAHGWWDDQSVELADSNERLLIWTLVQSEIPSKLALVHSEVSEALEDHRNGHDPREVRIENGKPEGFGVELADILIRVFDLAGALEIDLQACVEQKMAFNVTRPHRHGGKKA